MNKIIIAIVVLIVVGGGVFLLMGNKNQTSNTTMPTQMTQQTNTNPTATNSVKIENMAFSPATITVKVGSTVIWTNNDSVGHSATANDGSFDTGVFRQGESKSVTFSKAGTFTYHCNVHPYMKGTVIVQ